MTFSIFCRQQREKLQKNKRNLLSLHRWKGTLLRPTFAEEERQLALFMQNRAKRLSQAQAAQSQKHNRAKIIMKFFSSSNAYSYMIECSVRHYAQTPDKKNKQHSYLLLESKFKNILTPYKPWPCEIMLTVKTPARSQCLIAKVLQLQSVGNENNQSAQTPDKTNKQTTFTPPSQKQIQKYFDPI